MYEKNAHISFFSLLTGGIKRENRKEVLLLAETLRQSNAQQIVIRDYSVQSQPSEKAESLKRD